MDELKIQVFTFSCSFFDLTARERPTGDFNNLRNLYPETPRLPSGLGRQGFPAQPLGQIRQGTVAIGAIALPLVANPAGQLGQ